VAWILLGGFATLGNSTASAQQEPAAPKAQAPAADEKLPVPPPIADEELGPRLKTTPMPRRPPGPNEVRVDSTALPKDREGIWVLDFAFKPVRLTTLEVNGKRKQLHYLYYRVVNRTGKPRMFVPQFTLVTDTGKRYEDVVLPQAVEKIRKREDPDVDLYNAVDIMGNIPPSTKDGVDDTISGVAIWEGVDPHADGFKVYVRGLSDGYQVIPSASGDKNKPVIRHKTLRLDFIRRGDERNLSEREIQLADPPYEWVYWGDKPDIPPPPDGARIGKKD